MATADGPRSLEVDATRRRRAEEKKSGRQRFRQMNGLQNQ
jgi:hypothetical protein